MLLLQSCPNATIVLVNKDLSVTFDTLKFLRETSTALMKSKLFDLYIDQYKRFSPSISHAPLNYKPNIPQGHGDTQLGYECYLSMDCSEESESSIISAKCVALQQILRLAALKHGAAFASISGLLCLIEDPSQVLHLLSSIGKDSLQPVLDLDGSSAGSFYVHQRIPLGWDSYSKILLVAKSLPHLPVDFCLREDVQIEEINDLYANWLETSETEEKFFTKLRGLNLMEPKTLTTPLEKPEIITFVDIIKSIKGVS